VKLHVGASRIRNRVAAMAAHDAIEFLMNVWPELSPRQAEFIVTYLDEVTVNGAYLKIPESWKELAR
jgi:hypothetical protein